MIKGYTTLGIVGFAHIEKSWIWSMYVVKGKRCLSIPLIYPLYLIMLYVWKYCR
jgi:hypothetical protein